MVIMSCTHNLQLNGDDVHNYGRGIALEPFLHQVSGRATMMCLNETTVCKPLNYREHFFYKSLPQDIKQFAPRYKGVVNVNIEETPDGYVALTAYPYEPDSLIEDCKSDYDVSTDSSEEEQDDVQSNDSVGEISDQPGNCDTRIKVRRTGSMCVDDQYHSVHTNNTTVNPWIFKVYKEGLQRQLQSKARVVKQFILLENVTSKFQKPCVLDLKMGTRIHGDHDDEDKKIHHEIKSANTTTQQLGVRLCGMQVYQSKSDSFFCLDKYYGRKLDRHGLRSTLRRFFQDNYRTRQDLLRPVLQRLRSIRDSLKRLRTYRFYSSSLLIMYDGASSSSSGYDVELNTLDEVPDAGQSPAGDSADTQNDKPADDDTSNDRVRIDIRMIDFAKSTHQEMDSKYVHDGPDHGYIFGLTNLIKLLKEILKDDSSSSE